MTDAAFVGRSDELARFRALLADLPSNRHSRFLGRHRDSKAEQGELCKSRVVLVHGLGGSGKSRLLRQFEAMADGSLPDSPLSPGQVRTVFLDWEDHQRVDPARYAGVRGPSLVTVLDAVQQAVTGAFQRDAKAREHAELAFAPYRLGVAQLPMYAARFADVIAQSGEAGASFTSQDATVLLKSLASIGLTATGHPAGLLGLSPDQLAVSVHAAGRLSEAATRAVTGKRQGEMPMAEYDLVTDPERELTRRVAVAMTEIAGVEPLVVLLDTGEVIGDVAWAWLRRLTIQTGLRVIWVIGARFETEAEAGVDSPVAQFVRDIGSAQLVLMSPTRFDDLMISEYLRIRTSDRGYTHGEIDLIARFTRGLPLAVSLVADPLAEGKPVAEVCRGTHDGLPSSIISRLAARYLMHAEKQGESPHDSLRGDLVKVLSLAIAYGDLRMDPDLLSALWDVDDSLAAFQDLARLHDFVLPVSRRLHDDVRDVIRTDLLDPYRRTAIREANRRALRLYNDRLEEMRVKWPSLDEQLGHSSFTTCLLAALWHTFWAGNEAGLNLLIEILPVLAIADAAAADAAAGIADQFSSTFDKDQRLGLDLITSLAAD